MVKLISLDIAYWRVSISPQGPFLVSALLRHFMYWWEMVLGEKWSRASKVSNSFSIYQLKFMDPVFYINQYFY